MVANSRRKLERLQLGVNRKSTVTWWIGCWVVRIHTTVRKQVKGPKGPALPRRTRRGQRGGSKMSASRSAALLPTPALPSKTRSSRKVNHVGRKFLWAVKAANRLAARRPVRQLMEKVPEDYGYLSRRQAADCVRDLGVGETERWERFRRSWHLYSYKCRHVGAPVEGQSPLHFLCLRAPHVGGLDLLSLLRDAGLRPRTPEPPRLRTQVCRSCGYVGPSGSHGFGVECAARRRAEGVVRKSDFGPKSGPYRGPH